MRQQRKLGPFDKRIRSRRCIRCSETHSKCEGGVPCKLCSVSNQPCIVKTSHRGFISLGNSVVNYPEKSEVKACIQASPFTPDLSATCLAYLFSTFLCQNSVTGHGSPAEYSDLSCILQSSPALYNSATAIGALSMQSQGINSSRETMLTALEHYRSAVSSLRSQLLSPSVLESESILWTTFLLTLFELHYDASGAGFVLHFFHGTSQLLKSRGPFRHLTGIGRRFFLTVRVFEICRALIYTSETFLAQPGWQTVAATVWDGNEELTMWHPKEALLDLMVKCSTLGVQSISIIDSDKPLVERGILLGAVACEGMGLQSLLESWRQSAQIWSTHNCPHRTQRYDMRMDLALIYYHAISIYLSGIFDYHDEYNDIHVSTPTLHNSDIQTHLDEILRRAEEALKHTNLASILFLFPLRVAGARARAVESRKKIVEMLQTIARRGFVVTGAFLEDLGEVWEKR